MTTSTTNSVPPLTQLNEDEEMFRVAVRDFARAEVAPRVRAMEHRAEFDRTLIPKFAELGLMGIDVPVEMGGAGGTFFMSVLAVEELSAVDAATAILVDVQNTLVTTPIRLWGTEHLRQTYLPQLAGGKVGAYALSEADSGSDAFGLKTKAEKKGADWVLTGRKLFITNGAEADLFVVFANTDFSQGYKGITAFLVERAFRGFAVGKREDKMGIRASSTVELILDGCVVPAGNVIGEVGKGYKIAIETLNGGRIGIGAQMIGIARGAMDAALKYVKERHQFNKPIADFQAVQFQLAQAATELEASRLLVYNAARTRDAGQDYTREAAMAKLYASQATERITSLCLELFGGYGYTKEYPVEKFYRDAKIGAIYEGTSNMQLHTISKILLKD